MALIDAPDRPRAVEDEYFRRKDAEILDRAREEHRVNLEQTALAEALGAPDDETVSLLYGDGLRASSAELVEWIPAVEIAWVDGADDAERQELRRRFAATGQRSDDGAALLDRWLVHRPDQTLFLAGRRALRSRLGALDEADRRAVLVRALESCEAAGRASGGVLGLGALSSEERRHIDLIRHDLERSA